MAYLKLTEQQRAEHFANTLAAAVRYDVAQRTIQQWISLGSVSAVRIGKKNYKVDLRSVEAYLQQCEAQREVI